MPNSLLTDMLRGEARSGWVRLRTLLTLRWLAVAGQGGAVVFAAAVLGMKVPVELCALAILCSVAFNLISMQVYPTNARLSNRAAMLSMLFDVAQVSALLALTGGLLNPFVMLLLAPVTVSASALGLRAAITVALCAMAAISAMGLWSAPLILPDGAELRAPGLYLAGVWAALSISVIFMATYARRVAIENYRMTQALQAAQSALASEQRLAAIGGLAAAAAHELGTPLATIKLVSAELEDELSDRPELLEDAQLIRKQAERCRDILADLSQGGRSDEHFKRAPITALVEDAAEPHKDRGAQIILRLDGAPLAETESLPMEVRRRPEVLHGMRNLIQNAVEFAETTIWVDVMQGPDSLRIIVGDDGPGYPSELLDQLGDPYVRSRERKSKSGGGYQGMGLGLFIAKTLLERTGARVSFANSDRTLRRRNRGVALEHRRPTGATVAVVWSHEALEMLSAGPREALGDNPRFTYETI